MRKVIIICALCLLVTLPAAAKDVVYLNSGNVVSGKVIEKSDNGDITIETDKGETLKYSQFEYYKLDMGGKAPKMKEQRRYVSLEDRPNRLYFFAAELSGGSTIEWKQRQTFPLQLSVVNGLHFSQFFQVGIGLGVRYYINSAPLRGDHSPWAFPIYADLRGNFMSHDGRNLVPYWSLDAGYTLGDRNFFFSPTIGVSIGGLRNDVLIGIYYMGQFVNHPVNSPLKDNSLIDGLGLKVGFQF
jgi:hypothetical protein